MPHSPSGLRPLGLVLCVSAALAACSGTRALTDSGLGEGQVITSAMIQESGLSTGWEVLRRYANHLGFGEHATSGPTRITRRGKESIYLPERPILVVDGVRQGDFRALAALPARDIERVEILSSLQGTTRYGMGAASGVILVQTRDALPARK